MNKHIKYLALAVTFATSLGFMNTSQALTTLDNQPLTLPQGVKVWDAQAVQDKKTLRTKNYVSDEVIHKVNAQVVKDMAEKKSPLKSLANFKGNVINAARAYQLQGDNALGHNVAYGLGVYVSKDYINAVVDMTEEIANDPSKYKEATGFELSSAEKEELQVDKEALTNLKYDQAFYERLFAAVPRFQFSKLSDTDQLIINGKINRGIQDGVQRSIDQLFSDTALVSLEPAKRDAVQSVFKPYKESLTRIFRTARLNIKDYEIDRVTSPYGNGLYNSVRVVPALEGFETPFSLITYVAPAKDGIMVNMVIMNDTSFDYWNQNLKTMWKLTPVKGGAK